MSESGAFATIARTDVFRNVLNQLQDHVANCSPGDRLPSDRQLAQSLGVSRALVRQAIKVLEGLGLVQAKQGVGTFVLGPRTAPAIIDLTTDLDLGDDVLRQLLDARRAIEAAVLTAAFRNRTPSAIKLVSASVKEQAAGISGEEQEVRLDVRFESALGDICGNEVLRRIQHGLHEAWLAAQIALEPKTAVPDSYHDDHVAIFDNFRNGDLEGALQRMDTHLLALDR